jgi:hypothetical protein
VKQFVYYHVDNLLNCSVPCVCTDECIILPEKSSNVDSSKCIPVKGTMTATIDANVTATVQSKIERSMMRVIRDGMQDDVYVSGNVTKVSFVGFRSPDATSPNSSIQSEQQSKSANSLSGLIIALICVAMLVILLILALFVTQRRRKRETQTEMSFHDATVVQGDYLHSDRLVHSRVVPSILGPDIEVADIPGSLANKDELALEGHSPNQKPVKTGDLSVDDRRQGNESPDQHLMLCTNLPSFDAADYLTDTLSYDDSSTVGESTKSMYQFQGRGENPHQQEPTTSKSSTELNNALSLKEIASLIPLVLVEVVTEDEEDEISMSVKLS